MQGFNISISLLPPAPLPFITVVLVFFLSVLLCAGGSNQVNIKAVKTIVLCASSPAVLVLHGKHNLDGLAATFSSP